MAKIIGRFYFRKTTSGNLIGEYSNSGMTTVASEAANTTTPGQGFLGTYRSTWLEGLRSQHAELIITQKHPSGIFTIEWRSKGSTIFWGEGMMAGDLLIGDYRNFRNF